HSTSRRQRQMCIRDSNLMWEGLPSDEADYLRDNNGIALAPDAVEIEYQADTSLEFYLGIFLVGFIFVLMSIISVVIARKQKQQQAAAAPGV
ncbi:MAG: hypothetical protein KUG77_28850, partial [Nannocystaceae bacterium]|nr:hypothetical protein [Nannocystaceae bacterium]